jgi:hypothetical protein
VLLLHAQPILPPGAIDSSDDWCASRTRSKEAAQVHRLRRGVCQISAELCDTAHAFKVSNRIRHRVTTREVRMLELSKPPVDGLD